jgi:DinB superfamily
MQIETQRITKLLERSWSGPMWHGGTLQDILGGVSWQQAFVKPAGFKHNIYEYVCHMNAWRTFTVEQLRGNSGYTIEINSAQDWPDTYDESEASWLSALHDLEAHQAALIKGMGAMTDDKLDQLVPGRKFKWYALLHGIVHHDIYHSAQISLLKNQP